MSFKLFLFYIFFQVTTLSLLAKEYTVSGTIKDIKGHAIPGANITIKGTSTGTSSDSNGEYSLTFTSDSIVKLYVSFTGFTPQSKRITKSGTYSFTLKESNTKLGEIKIENKREREINQIRLNPKTLKSLPGTNLGGIETSIKTLPGVTSNSELSNQYSVRGGNYDENLIYVNGVKIFRPILVRSGKQEGLSFVNPDMVSSLSFSAGGFDASYGNKMASVLDVSYKKPKAFGVGFSANILGSNVYMEGISKNKKVSHITGVRYRNTSFLLSTLETDAVYKPIFYDVQSSINYKLSDRLSANTFVYGSANTYEFIPNKMDSKFNEGAQVYEMRILFDGKEYDEYYTAMYNQSFQYNFTDNLKSNFTYSHYRSNEKETFDIDAIYSINRANDENEIDNGDLIESGNALADGRYFSHARNYLFIETHSATISTSYILEKLQLTAGVTAQKDLFESKLNEWRYVDSAEYSRPYSDTEITLNNFKRHDLSFSNTEVSTFLQAHFRGELNNTSIGTTVGVRHTYTELTNENLIDPRLRVSIKPNWEKDIVFKCALGIYHQTPWYKEHIMPNGDINTDIKSQESIHSIVSLDYNLMLWGRPFKFVTEAFYKHFTHIIPYDVENVRIQYYPENSATGYAKGVDMKLNGEFVKGTESWFSASLLETKEDIDGDDIGYIRRPADRLLNLGVFFQDYLPSNDSYKMNLTMYYGTALPTRPPGLGKESVDLFTIPDYQRVDIGFLKEIFPNDRKESNTRFKSLWIGVEIFNLLDKSNTISYLWINDINGRYWPVPNSLTKRRVNLTITGKF